MKCSDTGQLIVDKLAGELSPGQAKKLEKHLAACEACRIEAEILSEAWQVSGDTLKDDSFTSELTPQRRSEILAATEYEEKRRHSTKIFYRLAEYFAIVLVCFVLGITLLPEFNKTKEKARTLPVMKTGAAAKMDIAQRDEEEAEKDIRKPAPVIKESRQKAERFALAPASATPKKSVAMKQLVDEKQERALKYAKLADTDEFTGTVKVKKELAPVRIKRARSLNRSIPLPEMSNNAVPGAFPASAVKRKAVKSELKELCCETSALPEKTFKLNLKFWKLETVKDVEKYLQDNKCPMPDKIKINKDKNAIIIQAQNTILEKIEKLFKKLQEEENIK